MLAIEEEAAGSRTVYMPMCTISLMSGIGGPIHASNPVCFHDVILSTISWLMRPFSPSIEKTLASKTSRTVFASTAGAGSNSPLGKKPPQVTMPWMCGCHPRKSPAVLIVRIAPRAKRPWRARLRRTRAMRPRLQGRAPGEGRDWI